MPKFQDLTGLKFGRLTVVKRAPNKKHLTAWECVCDCGRSTVVTSGHLKSGHTKSCGCIEKEHHNSTTHDMSHTRLYRIWSAMKARCYNSNTFGYKYYGERGIRVCDEWKESFESFYKWAISNGYDDKLSIDRIDNDSDYTPFNCRWATRKEQANNQGKTKRITYNGETHSLAEWADITGINYQTLVYRVNNEEWDLERALCGSRYQYRHEQRKTQIG